MKSFFLVLLVLVVLFLDLSRGQRGSCVKTGPCSCRYSDGSEVNLEPLSTYDGPSFSNVSDENGSYVSWNPCSPFSYEGTVCEDVAVCLIRDGIPYPIVYDLGRVDSARFTVDVNGSLTLMYTSDQDFRRSAIITLQCLENSPFDYFVNNGEKEPDGYSVIYEMVLASKHACPRYSEYTVEPEYETTIPYTIEPYTIEPYTAQPLPCTQISTCACMFPDGMVVNLESLTRYDGIPWFANITDSLGNAVSWNPCRSFTYTGTECFNTAVCVIRDGVPLKTYFNLGSDYSARFEADANRNLMITYRSNEGSFKRCQKLLILTSNSVTDAVAGQDQHFFKMSEGPFSHDAGHINKTKQVVVQEEDPRIIASIRLDCDYYSEDSFRLEGETMPDDYTIQFNMVLRSSRACRYMPTTTSPPIYTTEEHNGGCYQGNEICKCSFPNGTDINLEAVSKFDSTPFIATKEGDRISWNPCERFTFKGTSCVDTFVCIQVEEEDSIAFYGFNDPRFSMETIGVQTIVFENENDMKVTIALECLKGSENNFLMAERVSSPIGYYRSYRMILASKYSCPDYY